MKQNSLTMHTGVVAVVFGLLLVTQTSESRPASESEMTINELPFYSSKGIDKRVRFDPSCMGTFDTESYKKLYQVCEDCYYLYYDPRLTGRCKHNCFMNDAFRDCAADLLRDVEEYVADARRLHSKSG
ncbi:Arthropod neurohormone/Alpha-latrotoxin associated low molecular weight protein [Trinorchestia longiramus]|nr:Arthropod neurohormone/Alpha-latrotoxin associated low molecular weight protein [Trinorchestia longiramus]